MSLSLFTNTQGGGEYVPPVVSDNKLIRLLAKGGAMGIQDYRAFGFTVRTGSNRITHIFRAATGHLTGGKIYYQHFNTDTHSWGSEVLLENDTYNMEDVAGGLISDNKIIVFFTISDNGFNGHDDHTHEVFYKIYDLDMTALTGRVSIMGGSSGIPVYDRAWAFGKVQDLGTSGHHAIAFLQYNTDTVPTTNNQVGVLVTTDNFATVPTLKVVATQPTVGANECIVIACGAGKLIFLLRQYGPWRMWRSSDTGDNWTEIGNTTIGFINGQVKIYQAHVRDGMVQIVYQDRDSGCISISRNNLLTDAYNNTWNESEIIGYSATGDVSLYNGLGYPSIEYVGESEWGGDLWLVTFTKETQGDFTGSSVGIADIYWTVVDFDHPSGNLPTVPVLSKNVIPGTTTSDQIRIDVTNYTDLMLEDLQYFVVDASLAADFSSYLTAQWSYGNRADYIKPIHNLPVQGRFMYLFNLSPSTTVYFRFKAKNLTGESAYAYINETTTA